MNNYDTYNLNCVIVNFGTGSKVLKIAKQLGASGGAILLGKGSIKSQILELFDLTDVRKEIVLFLADESTAKNALDEISHKLRLDKPNHGIAFTSSVENIVGSHSCSPDNIESKGGDDAMYNAIFTIVDRGNAESVIDAAVVAGSEGGTIINARGSGIHEKTTLFSMVIEPEKEIVLILTEKAKTDRIVESIKESIEIEKPGNGIMFIINAKETYGLYKTPSQ